MSVRRRALAMLAIVSSSLGCDQGTKRLADLNLKDHMPLTYFGRTVRLLYAQNTGAWGSLGEGWPEPLKSALLIAMPTLMLVAVFVYALRRPADRWAEAAGFALVVGGGLGNLLDRVTHGYVVDFMYVGYGQIGTNIFNVADVAIMAGVGLLLLQAFLRKPALPAAAGDVHTLS